tara:strand:+ start:1331 stop:2416 length:1086 start_codon:yes stop_codon:yes gene_type:complete
MSDLKKDIVEIVTDILYHAHSDDEKRRLESSKELQLEMACPCCGDSNTNTTKKRGILYLDSFKYYCWNGDCDAKYWSIFKFFKLFGKKLNNINQISEITKVIEKSKRERKPTKLIDSSELFEFMYNNSIPMIDLEKHYGLFTAERCKWGAEFLNGRLLHRFDDRIRFRKNKFGNREVWVLNKIDENEKVVGLQIKNLDFGMKYSTKTFNTLIEEMNRGVELPEDKMFSEKLSTLSIIFNLFNVDIEKTITVFEGPFDSFFIPNSVATAGASKLKSFFDGLDNVRYWYDNDSTGKNSSIDKIKSKNKCFLWKRFFKNSAFNNKRVKDLNELVVYIYKNREFKHVLSHVKESFSKNKYDIYHV